MYKYVVSMKSGVVYRYTDRNIRKPAIRVMTDSEEAQYDAWLSETNKAKEAGEPLPKRPDFNAVEVVQVPSEKVEPSFTVGETIRLEPDAVADYSADLKVGDPEIAPVPEGLEALLNGTDT